MDVIDVFYSDLATQGNLSLIVHFATILSGQFTRMATARVTLRSTAGDVSRVIRLCERSKDATAH